MTDLEQERWNLDQVQRMTADYSEATGLASVIVNARGTSGGTLRIHRVLPGHALGSGASQAL